MPRKWLTVDQAAEIYGVSTQTIRRYITAGRITAYRVGPTLLRLDADQLERELLGTAAGGGAA